MPHHSIRRVSHDGHSRVRHPVPRAWPALVILVIMLWPSPGISQDRLRDGVRLESPGALDSHFKSPRIARSSWSQRSTDAPPYTRHLLETQFGGGPAWGTGGFGGVAQLHARFALWHTIGLGIYTGGLMVGSQGRDPIAAVPVVGRLNLSLPFWPGFEPVGSIGVGPYFFLGDNETAWGAQAALALLFPGRKFGVETILHVTEDPRYSSELAGYLTLAVTALHR